MIKILFGKENNRIILMWWTALLSFLSKFKSIVILHCGLKILHLMHFLFWHYGSIQGMSLGLSNSFSKNVWSEWAILPPCIQ